MAQPRLSMRKVREVLRLKFVAGVSDRLIAASVGSARSTVQECLRRAAAAKVIWPVPESLDDAQLEALLYPPIVAAVTVALPDFAHLHRELSRPGVTRRLLWEEYQAQHPEGLQYSAFCDHYRAWLKRSVEPVMRFEHRAGDKCFIDYAGQTMPIIDRRTGEIREAQIFIASLGCSNYTFAEATLSQSLPDWLGSHVRAVEFFGGAPAACVPDNLKSGVSRAHRYDPELNPAYAEWAEHYGTTILPARVRKPRDKAKVENAVLIVERWILAKLRDRQFFSLGELNAAIAELLTEYNHKPFQKMDGTRQSRFLELDRPALKTLPARPYEYAQWKSAKVHLDYHVEVERAYYSVPYRHIGDQVDVRMTARMIEIFYRRQLLATHIRLYQRGHRTTLPAHRPQQHRAIVDQSIERLIERAEHMGTSVAQILREQFNKKVHPEEALRAAQGILRLAQDFSSERLARACRRALDLRTHSYRAVRTLITQPAPTDSGEARQLSLDHDNVRGPEYFH
ncbi:MAG TPA: IS21 family transposase [Steroidobacteraceae bacterium]|nr:IS21 family transposase [Steroidobacteraceae bacterium]